MKPLTKQDVIDIIKEYNTQNSGTSSSFTVPFHRHNGSDSPKVLMGDLQSDSRGLQFVTNYGNITIGVPTSTDQNQLNIIGALNGNGVETTSLYMSGFTTSSLRARDTVFLLSGNTTFTSLAINNSNATFNTDDTSWFMRLPNNTVLPASPQVGDICIYGGILQVCETAGVWTPK